MHQPIFVFGYGSLINLSSIETTLFSLDIEPDILTYMKSNELDSRVINKTLDYDNKGRIVRVNNIKRGWFHNIEYPLGPYPWTALAAYRSHGYITNGVLFPVSESQVASLDNRENGYIKMQIPLSDVSLLQGDNIPQNAIIYFYAIDKKNRSKPTDRFPVLQSYVDKCMIGTIMIDRLLKNEHYEFTNEFITTTYQWDHLEHWINDRTFHTSVGIYAGTIDAILNKYTLVSCWQESSVTALLILTCFVAGCYILSQKK